MKRILSAILVFTLLLCTMFAGSSIAFAEEAAATKTVIDFDGTELEVPADPQRIVVLPDAICSLTWLLMGGADRMVCLTDSSMDDWSNYLGSQLYPEMADMPHGIEQNVEELLTYDPDLIISMSGGTAYQEQNDALAALGYPVYMISSEALYGDPVSVIREMGALLNCEDRAAQLIQYMGETDAYIAEKMETVTEGTGKRVYNTVWVDDMKAWTAGSFNGAIIDALKSENISYNEASSTAFSMEEIITYDPEIVIISFADYTVQDFYNNAIPGQDWSTISAIKNGQVYRSPALVQRWAQSFCTEKFLYKRWMASVIYPDVFPMSEVKDYIKSYLKDFHGYEITDEALAQFMNSEENGL